MIPEFHDILIAVRRLRTAINAPWQGAAQHDVQEGRGKIAAAYKAADALNKALGREPERSTVTELKRVH